MKIKDIIIEALKPSEYRPIVKGWDKTRYAELFNNQYRLYFPIIAGAKSAKVNPQITQAIQSVGYQIDDYKAGIASKTDDPSRKIKIGKLLKDPQLQNIFANDPTRAASKSEQLVVISRHPYDIAGMSTDRGWTSCMNLAGGIYNKFVPLDVKAGTVIAYLINANDKNIQNPIARMLIKPFVNLADDTIAFGIENKIYGTASPEFKKTILNWVNGINKSRKLDGIYIMDKNLYQDGPKHTSQKIHGPDKAMWTELLKDPIRFLKNNPDVSERVQLVAVTQEGYAIRYIENPSERVQLAAVTQDGNAIRYIENPSERVQLVAVTENGTAIQYIKNPSERVQLVAVTENGGAIEYIKNPTERVQLAAVTQNGWAIRYIENPSERVQLAAVTQNGNAIEYIKNPSERVQLAAVTQDGYAIRYIENPSERVQLAAVTQDGWAIQYIKNPTERVQLAAKENK